MVIQRTTHHKDDPTTPEDDVKKVEETDSEEMDMGLYTPRRNVSEMRRPWV